MEQRQFDEAVSALRAALALNPSNAIATNLLTEVRRRRAMTPTAASRVNTGFSTREFTLLEAMPGDAARQALAPRIEALFDTLNGTSIAARIVESRQRQGESGSKLFHANSFHANTTGRVVACHHGGRWGPQLNLGWFSSPPHPSSCMRIGNGNGKPRTARPCTPFSRAGSPENRNRNRSKPGSHRCSTAAR